MSHLGGDWYEDVDPNSGAAYYTNYSTGEVTWEFPSSISRENEEPPDPPPPDKGEWVKVLDESSGRYYFQHSVTGESRWEDPTAPCVSPDAPAPEDDPANWTSGVDESTGYAYYYNSVTQVTQWEAPTCLGDVQSESQNKQVDDEPSSPPPSPSPSPPPPPPTSKQKSDINASDKKASVPPPPKKASIAPPPKSSSQKKASVVPPPPPPSGNKVKASPEEKEPKSSTVPPPPKSPLAKKSSTAPPPKISKKNVSISTPNGDESDIDGKSKDVEKPSSPPPKPSSPKSTIDSEMNNETVDAPTEGVRKMGLSRTASKQKSFAALRALETEAGGDESDKDDDSSTPVKRNKELSRESSMLMTAPEESGTGHAASSIQMLASKDDLTTHELCEQVFDVTFQQYGEKNYNFERKGIFKGRTTIEKMTTWKADLIKTSLRILSPELSSEAVQTFKNVTGYMKDRSSSKADIDHAIKILNLLMLAPEELRDELYCQLCKQTNGNPKPESTERGWQLFMIALATVPPSFDLKPHLMAYFVENLTSKIPNVAKYAEICLHRCPKICKLGARRELPSRLELESIRRGGAVSVRVFFLDLKYITLRVDSWTTVRELEDSIASALKVQNSQPFSLCEVSTTEDERIPDPDERIMDIISFWSRTALEATGKGSTEFEEFCFQYKVGLFYDIEDTDLAAVELFYIQATHDIVDSRYPCSEQDSITLAALQMQEEYGDYPGDGKCTYLRGNLGKYITKRLIEQSENGVLEDKIYALYAKLTGYSQLEARLSYLDYVKSWKIYGSTYFFVEPQDSKELPKECVLAVNGKGITVISPTTKEFLAEYNYSTVVTWGHSPNSFVIVTGTQTRQVKVYFKTDQGKELNNMVKSYIEHRKA